VVCAAVAVTVQYWFLCMFFLMLVQAIALIVKLKASLPARSRLTTYCIIGCGQCTSFGFTTRHFVRLSRLLVGFYRAAWNADAV